MTCRKNPTLAERYYHSGLYNSLRNEASPPLRAWMDRRKIQIILLTILQYFTEETIAETAAQAKSSNRYSTYRVPIGEVVLLSVLDRLNVRGTHEGVPFGYVRIETHYQNIPGLHRYAHDFKAWHLISGGAFSGEWRWVKKGQSAKYRGKYTIYGGDVTRTIPVSGSFDVHKELTDQPLTNEHIMEWIDEDIGESIQKIVNDEDDAAHTAAQAALTVRLKGLPPETASYVQDLFDAMTGDDPNPKPPAGVSAEKWMREIEHIFAKANFYPA